jgi:hypothetical protein
MSEPIFNRENVAREAILAELKRRWIEDRHTGGITCPVDLSKFFHPQTNYFCGQGTMDCPICSVGTLRYYRNNYNGHVHAACSTDGCVNWME